MKTFLIYNLLKTFTIRTIVVPSLSFIVTTISTIKSTLFGVVFIITKGISKPVWGSTVCARFFSWLWVFQAFASIAVVGVALHFVITTISSIKSTLGGVVLIVTIIVSKPLWGSTFPHGLFSGLHWIFGGIPRCFSSFHGWFSGFWHFKALTEAAVVIPTLAGVITTIASIKSALGVVVFVITEIVTGPLGNGTLHWSFGCWFRG